jgi:hypothetical protein
VAAPIAMTALVVGTLGSAFLENTGSDGGYLIDRFKAGLKDRLQGGVPGPRFRAGVMAVVSEGGPAAALSGCIPVTNSPVTEVVNGRSQAVRRDLDRRKRDGQPEAPSARASWIQVEHAVDRVDLRHMGVAGHDDVDAARDRIDLQCFQIVKNVDRPFRKANELGLSVREGPVAGIHVSSDRGDRGNAAKRVDDVGTPDIAAMNDMIDAGQATLRFRRRPCVSEMMPIR